ncbi:MAG: D-alanyl-D-alanine carboxypeptidase [Marmoricola sp.]|nr:D-alanyl-D-alanine carboxypeptidase [Marmoricola sp.]
MREVSRRGLVTAAGAVLLTAACGTGEDTSNTSARTATGTRKGTPTRPATSDVAVDPPGKLTDALLSSDILVYSQNSLDKGTIAKIKAIKGVDNVELISMGSFFVEDREVTYAAVHPDTFRRFTKPGTAQTQAVWNRVAGGEIAVEPTIGRQLGQKGGYMRLGNEATADTIHIGAYASLLNSLGPSRIDAVVNYRWTDRLGMRPGNAMLVALGEASPASILKQLKKYVGRKAQIEILAQNPDLGATQTAFLTGGSVAAAVGSFSYTANPDGTVTPDPAWVAAKITTEEMPIIGRVTGNRVMLPQLRAALNEVVALRLSSSIYHYDGCYVPRFIARDPSKGLSFHTFGTAIDLNAADNYRGIPGRMDRRVVAIFKKWGFAWGGDWNYTDPMHFELARLVEPR